MAAKRKLNPWFSRDKKPSLKALQKKFLEDSAKYPYNAKAERDFDKAKAIRMSNPIPRDKWINAKIRITKNGTIQAKIKR